jgi:phosphoglycolate phosphatase
MNPIYAPITLIFDFDGTIADTPEMMMKIYNRVAPEYGCRLVTSEERGILRTKKPQEFLKEYGMHAAVLPLFLLRMQKEMGGCIADAKPVPGISTALRGLKTSGFTIGIISSNAVENVRLFLKVNALADLFDFVWSGSNVFGKDKVIRRLMRKVDLSPEHAIYIGDETRDIEAARKAHIPMVAVSWGYQAKEILSASQPDRIADEPGELIGCIERILRQRGAGLQTLT